jgi:hypothetical protein
MAERFGLSRRRVSQFVAEVTASGMATGPGATRHEQEAV